MLKYTEEHEWLSLDSGVATVGITAHAAEQLGDLVFVELPEVGSKVAKGDKAATVESVKAVSDVYAPLSGEITEVNAVLTAAPEKLNADPHGEGWLVKIKLTSPDELSRLLSAADYQKYIGA